MNESRRDKEREGPRETTLVQIIDAPQEWTRKVINMIIGGEYVRRESLGKRKAHAHKVYSISTSKHPQH